MESYLARQPILDVNQEVYGYELLYRKNTVQSAFSGDVDADQASSSVMLSLQNIGIDKVTVGKKAFINFTWNFVNNGYATLFSNDVLVVEILESLEPTPELFESCRQIKELGYTIALDDFVYSPAHQPLLDLCSIIKVDFMPFSIENYRNILKNIVPGKVTLLAEKVETQEDFELAKKLGFKLFQGYFFSKPVTLKGAGMSPNRMTYLQLLNMIYEPDVNFGKISDIIRRDLALSYKMLRLVNSAFYGTRSEIRDVRQAVAFLGEKELKKWVSLISMVGLSEDKPSELMRMSVIRARFCEQASLRLKYRDPDAFFLTGLFSLIDAIMDTDMEAALSQMPLPEFVLMSLIEKAGPGAYMLTLLEAIETADWEKASLLAQKLGIDAYMEGDLYMDALAWSSEMDVPPADE